MSILTEAAAAVREALPLRRARHAAISTDHLDCPEGSPGGPCEACGSETSRKQPYVATGVYSPYALCEDRRACEDRGTRKERQAAIRDRAEGEREAGEDVHGPLVTCAACGHDAPHTGMLNATCTEGEPGCREFPAKTVPMCPEGCGCRLDGEDADRRECGCDGPCTGEDEDDSDDAGNAAGRS